LSLFDRVLGPVVTIFEWSTKKLLSLVRLTAAGQGGGRGDEAQHATVELGLLSSQHRQYVMNLVDLERKRVKDICLPWSQVVKADVRMSARELEGILLASGHTRVPVLDREVLIGILNAKEFLALHASGSEPWLPLLRRA